MSRPGQPLVLASPGQATVPAILAPVVASWAAWWTTYDPTLPTDPGLTLASGNVSSWIDQRSGWNFAQAITAQQPPYAADGANFKGRSVIQAAPGAQSKLLKATGTFFPQGARPYIVIVFRQRVLPASGAYEWIAQLYEANRANTGGPAAWNNTKQIWSNLNLVDFNQGGASLIDTSMHVVETWNTPSAAFSRLDGVATGTDNTANSGITTPAGVTQISIGNRVNELQPANVSIAEVIILNSYPGDTIALKLVAALRAKWANVDVSSVLAPVASSWVAWWTTYDPTLGTNPGITLNGGAVSSWVDQKSGWNLAQANASKQPAYAADNTNFLGRNVVQTSKTGPQCLKATGTTFFAAGSRPYMVAVVRSRVVPSVSSPYEWVAHLFEPLRASSAFAWNTTQQIWSRVNGIDWNLGSQLIDRSVHVLELWNTPTGAWMRFDGIVSATDGQSNSGLTAQGITEIGLGASNTEGSPSNTSIAEVIMLNAYPGDAIALQLVSALKSKWAA